MANPIKAVKAAKRLIVGSNKDFKTNKGINKKLDKILNTSVISQGKAKAIKRNVRVKEFMPIAKGSNKKVGASAKAGRGFIKSKVKAYHLAQAKKPEDMMVDEETMRQQCKKYSLKLYYDNEL